MSAPVHTPPAVFFVSLNGINVSSTFNRYLIALKITDNDGSEADSCEITLDDTNGQLAMPDEKASIIAGVGWQDTGPIHVFEGTIDEPISDGSRSHGRLLILNATSYDPGSTVKSTQNKHMDQGTFEQAAQNFSQSTGLTVKMDQSIGSINRNYWSMGNESFTQWGERMARIFGATFKIQGTTAAFGKRNSGNSTSGQALATIECDCDAVSGNVIHWHITPLYNQTQFQNFTTGWFDPKAAEWNYVAPQAGASVAPGGLSSDATATLNNRFKSPDQQHAQLQSASNQAEAQRSIGGGSIRIIGEPAAIHGCTANVTGCRPQIDGQYYISKSIHTLTRGQGGGYVTDLELTFPLGSPSGSGTGGGGAAGE